jgi:uncharacterized protein (TIGR00369 family)
MADDETVTGGAVDAGETAGVDERAAASGVDERAATAAALSEVFESMGALADRMGVEVLSAAPERVVGRMPVVGNTQPYGLLHGGASCVLAETVGSVGAALHAGPGGRAVGIEINASHHRGVRDGSVTATATALRLGRSLATYEIEVVDDAGRRVCTARLSCMIQRSTIPGSDS